MALEVGDRPFRYEKLRSTRFLCRKCMRWVIEWTPVIERGMMPHYAAYVRRVLGGRAPKVWFQCPAGCPRGTGVYDVRDDRRTMRPNLS